MRTTKVMLLGGMLSLGISLNGWAAESVFEVTFADGSKGNLTQKLDARPESDKADYTKTRYHFMNTQEGPDVQADHVYIVDDAGDGSRKKVVMVRERQQMKRDISLSDRNEVAQTKASPETKRTVSTAYCKLNPGDSCQVSLQGDNADMGRPFAVIKRTQ